MPRAKSQTTPTRAAAKRVPKASSMPGAEPTKVTPKTRTKRVSKKVPTKEAQETVMDNEEAMKHIEEAEAQGSKRSATGHTKSNPKSSKRTRATPLKDDDKCDSISLKSDSTRSNDEEPTSSDREFIDLSNDSDDDSVSEVESEVQVVESHATRTSKTVTCPAPTSGEKGGHAASRKRTRAASKRSASTTPEVSAAAAAAGALPDKDGIIHVRGPTDLERFLDPSASPIPGETGLVIFVGHDPATRDPLLYVPDNGQIRSYVNPLGKPFVKGAYYHIHARPGGLLDHARRVQPPSDIPHLDLKFDDKLMKAPTGEDAKPLTRLAVAGLIQRVGDKREIVLTNKRKTQMREVQLITMDHITTEVWSITITVWGSACDSPILRYGYVLLFLGMKQSIFREGVRLHMGDEGVIVDVSRTKQGREFTEAASHQIENYETNVDLPGYLRAWDD